MVWKRRNLENPARIRNSNGWLCGGYSSFPFACFQYIIYHFSQNFLPAGKLAISGRLNTDSSIPIRIFYKNEFLYLLSSFNLGNDFYTCFTFFKEAFTNKKMQIKQIKSNKGGFKFQAILIISLIAILLIIFLIIKLLLVLLPAILIVLIFWYLFQKMNKLKKKTGRRKRL